MNILIAMDSWKGSLTSLEAGAAVADGIRKALPDSRIRICPVADGGEGTVDALVAGLNGRYREATVSDPLGRPVKARYGILPGGTAVIEMSAASGITLLHRADYDPMHTSTYGTGELIADALHKGCRKLIIGIGGSATNDAGVGCLQALGFRFYDAAGKPCGYGAAGVSDLLRIDGTGMMPELADCTIRVACDVKNPLCGPQGCSVVFGPQKGATAEMIEEMDQILRRFAALTCSQWDPAADPETPGAGAAGGLGFSLLYYLHAALEPGIGLILQETQLAEQIREADIVVTGEGCLDQQTVMGKAPIGIAALAKQFEKPVIAFSGVVRPGASVCNHHGIDAFFPAVRDICTLEAAMQPATARHNLAEAAEQAFRLLALGLR